MHGQVLGVVRSGPGGSDTYRSARTWNSHKAEQAVALLVLLLVLLAVLGAGGKEPTQLFLLLVLLTWLVQGLLNLAKPVKIIHNKQKFFAHNGDDTFR